ncbi:restriction endonuclease subunit S [Aliarcobacter cryaerophilus]|uniref:restriction endonuclease subunit S n=1 Tax=Aliarcobacter cryaerophilus TaxID=28198 RepID=UPI0008244B85|nr:restriction endonuclease subunit S [Aliarcobacter cryaerophilus]
MSELYSLPNGWEWKTLSDIFNIERGGSPRPIKDYITDDEDGINWIKISDATKGDGKYIESTEQKIKPIGLKNTRLVVDGDFIMSNSMSFGKPYIVKTKGAIHDGWLLMREKIEKTDKEFFYYLLSSNYMYEQFSSKASGTTVKNLNIDMVKTTNIPLPPLEEQKRIVAKLDNLFSKIDKVIALHQKNIDEADIFMASVLNDVFIELEEKYPLKKVSDGLKNILTGTTPPTKEEKYYNEPSINWYSPSDFGKSKVLSISKNMINSIALTDKKAKIYEKNTLLLVAIGATVGKIGVIKEEASSNQQITAMKFKDDIDVDFSYYWFYYIKQIIINTASAATLPIINQSAIKDLKFIIPPLPTQQKVVSYLDEISQKMEKIKQIQKEKMQSLKELKASILDKAFKGEL